MQETKVQFSAAEMELMCNSEIILTKNKVIEKVKVLLGELQNEMMNHIYDISLSDNAFFYIHPKISKGENYLGLPYLILDYPRLFKHQESFAIRTMFWWGNFYSVTLHLSGLYKQEYASKLVGAFKLLSEEDYSIGINSDPWVYHFEWDNYTLISLLGETVFGEECQKRPHLKISKKFSLNESNLPEELFKSWKLLTKICFD